MLARVKSLESSLAFSKGLINVSHVAGGGEPLAHGDLVRLCRVLRELGWDPGGSRYNVPGPVLEPKPGPGHQPSWGGCLAVCPVCLSARHWGPGGGERKGELVADLGNTQGSIFQRQELCQAQGRQTAAPESERGGSWTGAAGLASCSVGAQRGKGNCSQTAEVCCGLMEKGVRPGGRMRWPSSLYPLLPARR